MEEKLENEKAIKRSKRPYRKNKKPIQKKKNDEIFKKENLKIIPLGGLLEVGKNLTVFEYKDDIIIVDCGLGFPEISRPH